MTDIYCKYQIIMRSPTTNIKVTFFNFIMFLNVTKHTVFFSLLVQKSDIKLSLVALLNTRNNDNYQLKFTNALGTSAYYVGSILHSY